MHNTLCAVRYRLSPISYPLYPIRLTLRRPNEAELDAEVKPQVNKFLLALILHWPHFSQIFTKWSLPYCWNPSTIPRFGTRFIDEKHTESNMNMCGFSKKQFSVHKKISFAVVVVYMLITFTIELFHNEEFQSSSTNPNRNGPISDNDECPACKFLAGHKSTGSDYSPVLARAESLLSSQLPPIQTIYLCDEWASSIISRAPPSTAVS